MTAQTSLVIAETNGGTGFIKLNNRGRRNAISLGMWEAIVAAIDRFERDPATRVVVFSGAGGTFVSGADISEFSTNRASQRDVAEYDEFVEQAVQRIVGCSKPTIAAIEKFCIGAGIALALACDMRIAANNAVFAIPAARLGIGYNWKDLKKLIDIIGPTFAREMLITGRRFSAGEAHHMGLVNRVVPDAEIQNYVQNYCVQIAKNAPLTMEAAKGVIAELLRPSKELDMERCDALVARCAASEDYAEGFRAFMEKRNPVFVGR